MLGTRTYLDFNASAPLHPAARATVLLALDQTGNASSIHAEGRKARALVEDARAQVASMVGTSAKNVLFTSGGTEAANLVLVPQILGPGFEHVDALMIGATEHACVLAGHRFAPKCVAEVNVHPDGTVNLAFLASMLEQRAGQKIMLAVQHANSETGVVQPVAEASALVHRHGGVVVCDIVQSAGRLPCHFGDLGADFVFLSAHKIGGPRGVGALVYDHARYHLSAPMLRGGGQERGARAGTENVAGIAGFGAAAAAIVGPTEAKRLGALRDLLEAKIFMLAPDAVFFGVDSPRLANTSAFAIPGLLAETAVMALDLEGMAISSGSACSSGKVKRSHVLDAMGMAPELSRGALRVSLGWSSTEQDIEAFVAACATVFRRARRMKAA